MTAQRKISQSFSAKKNNLEPHQVWELMRFEIRVVAFCFDTGSETLALSASSNVHGFRCKSFWGRNGTKTRQASVISALAKISGANASLKVLVYK